MPNGNLATKSIYVQGSSAPQLQEQVERREKYRALQKKHINRKMAKARFKNNIKMGVLLMFPCMLLLYGFANIASNQFEIRNLQQELQSIKQQNQKISMSIAQNISPEQIKNIAITKLNMQEPSGNQIIEINVPKTDYTVSSSELKDND